MIVYIQIVDVKKYKGIKELEVLGPFGPRLLGRPPGPTGPRTHRISGATRPRTLDPPDPGHLVNLHAIWYAHTSNDGEC